MIIKKINQNINLKFRENPVQIMQRKTKNLVKIACKEVNCFEKPREAMGFMSG